MCGVEGTLPPRLSPEGKRERGGQIPCCRRRFPFCSHYRDGRLRRDELLPILNPTQKYTGERLHRFADTTTIRRLWLYTCLE